MGELFSIIMAAVLVIGIATWGDKRDKKRGIKYKHDYMKDGYC